MPAVSITSREQYEKALSVLTRVGGTFQGVGSKERFLLVTEAQFRALVQAKVISPGATDRDSKIGKKSRKNGQP